MEGEKSSTPLPRRDFFRKFAATVTAVVTAVLLPKEARAGIVECCSEWFPRCSDPLPPCTWGHLCNMCKSKKWAQYGVYCQCYVRFYNEPGLSCAQSDPLESSYACHYSYNCERCVPGPLD